MRYHLVNVETAEQRMCQTVDEALEAVNEIVAGQQEWVIRELPEDGDGGARPVIESGRGPTL